MNGAKRKKPTGDDDDDGGAARDKKHAASYSHVSAPSSSPSPSCSHSSPASSGSHHATSSSSLAASSSAGRGRRSAAAEHAAQRERTRNIKASALAAIAIAEAAEEKSDYEIELLKMELRVLREESERAGARVEAASSRIADAELAERHSRPYPGLIVIDDCDCIPPDYELGFLETPTCEEHLTMKDAYRVLQGAFAPIATPAWLPETAHWPTGSGIYTCGDIPGLTRYQAFKAWHRLFNTVRRAIFQKAGYRLAAVLAGPSYSPPGGDLTYTRPWLDRFAIDVNYAATSAVGLLNGWYNESFHHKALGGIILSYCGPPDIPSMLVIRGVDLNTTMDPDDDTRDGSIVCDTGLQVGVYLMTQSTERPTMCTLSFPSIDRDNNSHEFEWKAVTQIIRRATINMATNSYVNAVKGPTLFPINSVAPLYSWLMPYNAPQTLYKWLKPL